MKQKEFDELMDTYNLDLDGVKALSYALQPNWILLLRILLGIMKVLIYSNRPDNNT